MFTDISFLFKVAIPTSVKQVNVQKESFAK